MDKVKCWLNGARKGMGSMGNISFKHTDTQVCPQKTEFEMTSMKFKYLLEKKRFQKVVDTLRDLPHNYILKCLQSFPFKALNHAVPESFPIWETLLTKLHNSEEGYIPQFPYAACDELVLQIAWLLEKSQTNPHKLNDLIQSCKRVLKRVYMQYNEVLEYLYKEHNKVEHALYTLSLHLPLGTDAHTAISLQQAIKEEVQACIDDYSDSIERLDEVLNNEVLSLSEMLTADPASGTSSEDENDRGLIMKISEFPLAPNPNQVQLQERLYQNQCVLTNLQPSRRGDNLSELLEFLKERVRGDKEVLAIFGSIRRRNEAISDSEPVEPWLKKQQHAIECVIGTIKEIEKKLEIRVRKSDSPIPIRSRTIDSHFSVPFSDDSPQIVPIARPRSISLETAKSPAAIRRHSATITVNYSMEEESSNVRDQERSSRNHLIAPHTYRRPRSASPHKILSVSGGEPPMRSGSSKSINSSNGSCTNLHVAVGTSSSVHDLHSTKDNQPTPAFTRVQSLKTNQSVQVVAGKRKKFKLLPNSMNNLSSLHSGGNGGSKKSKKGLFRSGSGGLGLPSDERKLHQGSNGINTNYLMLQQDLECKSKELLHAREMIQELRRRERELTDRLSEQAQRHLQGSEKFEDILLGTSRPTLVIQRYQELHSQGRMNALDAIEAVDDKGGPEDENGAFGIQLVLDVLKFSYESTCLHLEKLHRDWKGVLCVGLEDKYKIAVRQLESSVGLYLRRICTSYDAVPVMEDVKAELSLKYGHSKTYNEVFKTDTFQSYIQECCKLTWDLRIQSPPMEISCHDTLFDEERHTRFFRSNKESSEILMYHWPTLIQSSFETVLYRGSVQT